MIKILTLGILFFLLYRLIFVPSKRIEGTDPSDDNEDQSEVIDIDYEDVDP